MVSETVFVRSIVQDDNDTTKITVEASNAKGDFVRFTLPDRKDHIQRCSIGHRYSVTIEEFD